MVGMTGSIPTAELSNCLKAPQEGGWGWNTVTDLTCIMAWDYKHMLSTVFFFNGKL